MHTKSLQLCPTLCNSARLLCPWNSPGKNNGVDCQALLQGICPLQGSNPSHQHCRQIFLPFVVYFSAWIRAKSLQSCLTLRPHGLWPTRLLCLWDSPGKNTGVGFHVLLQYILVNNIKYSI